MVRVLFISVVIALLGAGAFARRESDYDKNIYDMSQALQKTKDFSVYGSNIEEYYMGPYVHPYSQTPMTIFVPNNKAVETFLKYPKAKWPGLARFLMANGKVTIDQIASKGGKTISSAQGCPIYILSKPGDKHVVISGAKKGAKTARIVKPNLFTSSTVTAHGIDAMPLPCGQ